MAFLDQARGRDEIWHQGEVTEPERRSRGMARLTATFTSAGGDLLEQLKLFGGYFFSARRRRAPAGEWGVERGQMRGRRGFQRGCRCLYRRVGLV
jgi:hypothetical protein